MENKTKLRVVDIEKSFPGVKALDKINFSVDKGSVHVLCGENGAGKSTLMKIINGIYKQDKGQIYIDEKQVTIRNPIHAREHGISMIFQELNYIPEMTVEESLFVGNWPRNKYNKIDWKEIRKRTLELLEKENLNYSPTTKLKNLTVSDIQMLEIIKAISYNAEIIIMDEPTSAITHNEVEVLFDKINDLKNRGTSIIYISHKMDEIFRIADQITVFRDGRVVGSHPKAELDIDKVIAMMVGRKLDGSFPKEEVKLGENILEVDNLSNKGKFKKVNFNLRAGEIVGFAGLMGAGRTEVMRSVFGLDPYQEGTITIHGKEVKIKRVSDLIKRNLVMLTEDRRRFGIIPIRSVRENAALASLKRFIYKGRLHEKMERETIKSYCDKMRVKTPDYETTIESLSGGNQQKVLLAKWMITNPEVFILDEPTRGIDVGAKYEIYKLMTEIVKEGKGVIMVSSELPELIGMCDRIYVMAKGRITGMLSKNDFTQENIMKLAVK